MKIDVCRNCGMSVAFVKTKKGTGVVCEVYWDGEHKVYMKNHQPMPHNCIPGARKNKYAKKRF